MTNPTVTGLDTMQETIDSLKQIVAGRADFVYERDDCVYVDDGTEGARPSCLVGHLLAQHGVPLEWLRKIDQDNNSTASFVAQQLGLSGDVAALLTLVQTCQDSGWAWGKVVDLALTLSSSVIIGSKPSHGHPEASS